MANPTKTTKTSSLFSAEAIEAQGRADREYLTERVKLLLQVKEKHPSASFGDISQIANDPCGRGCCCCCDTLVLGGELINPAPTR